MTDNINKINVDFDLNKSGAFTETEEWVKVRGVASDESVPDLQGEIVKVNGIDTSYVGISSYLKWEHSQDNPAVYVGTIDKSEKVGAKLIIEGKIFKNTQQGRDVIDLMKALKAVGRTMQMSIEGRVIQRSTQNPKIIEKSKFTHCALTLLPINRNTSLDFAKSENKKENLFDHTDEETGKRVIVRKDLSIEVIDKAITAENMETKKEDVEKPRSLNKSETIDYIFSKFGSDIEKSERIYNFINKVKQNLFPDMEGKEITEDVLKKAEEILEASAKESQEIKKSEDELKEIVKSEEKTKEPKKEIMKAEKPEEKKEEKKEEKEDENPFQKAMKAYKSMSDEDKKKMAEEISKMKKAEEPEEEKEEKKEEVKKSEASLAESIDAIVKSNAHLQELWEKAQARLEKIEGKPVEKSVSDVAYHERFEKSESAAPKLSMSQNRKEISDLLLEKSGVKTGNVDDDILKSVAYYQTNGFLKSEVVEKMKNIHGIEIVK